MDGGTSARPAKTATDLRVFCTLLSAEHAQLARAARSAEDALGALVDKPDTSLSRQAVEAIQALDTLTQTHDALARLFENLSTELKAQPIAPSSFDGINLYSLVHRLTNASPSSAQGTRPAELEFLSTETMNDQSA